MNRRDWLKNSAFGVLAAKFLPKEVKAIEKVVPIPPLTENVPHTGCLPSKAYPIGSGTRWGEDGTVTVVNPKEIL